MDRLQGKTVLLVEDEPIVAMLVEDMLAGLGVSVIGPAARLEEALSMAQTETFDAAVLDVKLGGQNSVAVAMTLRERGIPYILATGFDSPTSPEYGRDAPVLNKPYLQDDLEHALRQVLAESPSAKAASGR